MPRIIGVDIPDNKPLRYALCYIYGIGSTLADEVLLKAKLDGAKRARDLTDEEIRALTKVLQSDYRLEGDLRRQISQDIRRLASINCYRGRRHHQNLPVRGQRTSTNARTRKGPKKTIGAIRGKTLRSAAKTGAR